MSNIKIIARVTVLLLFVFFIACQTNVQSFQTAATDPFFSLTGDKTRVDEVKSAEVKKLLANAVEQIKLTVNYDPAYTTIPYPNGDVPIEKGVCTDVVIRAFRAANVDLQKEVHEDMAANFAEYPKKWNLKSPDANIDHRRVPNLQTFFTRRGKAQPITSNRADYAPGDVVSWDLNNQGMTHIGLVSNIYNENTGRYLIIHNIGGGTIAEDVVFDWRITGHFRYF